LRPPFPRVVADRRDHANHRAVGAIETQCVEHQERLAPVLARDDAAVALIPVEHQLVIDPFLDDQLVDDGGALWRLDRDAHLVDRLPPGARQAVERRMDGVAFALLLVEPHVEARRLPHPAPRTALARTATGTAANVRTTRAQTRSSVK